MTHPTDEAMMAAKALDKDHAIRHVAPHINHALHYITVQAVATVIDQATGLPALKARVDELEEALQQLLDCSIPTGMDTRTDRAMERAEKVLSKMEDKQPNNRKETC